MNGASRELLSGAARPDQEGMARPFRHESETLSKTPGRRRLAEDTVSIRLAEIAPALSGEVATLGDQNGPPDVKKNELAAQMDRVPRAKEGVQASLAVHSHL